MKKKAMAESVLPSLWLRNMVREMELAQESPDKTWNLTCYVLWRHSIIRYICTHTRAHTRTHRDTHSNSHAHTQTHTRGHTPRHRHRHRHRHRRRHRRTHRQTDTQTDTQTDRHTTKQPWLISWYQKDEQQKTHRCDGAV